VRVALISDVHGNLHALEAVLKSIGADAPDTIWCLGDLVGYGPQPNPCCSLVAERAELCLIGNHDLGVLGGLDLAEFSHDAAASARWTAEVLSDESRAYLEPLQPQAIRAEVGLYHASPRDPVWEYVLSPGVAFASLEAAGTPLVLVGHSHVALSYEWGQQDLVVCEGGTQVDFGGQRWLLNPGSVGQPRDGDPRAAYVLLDLDSKQAEFKRVRYDIAKTQAEIREHGLPEALAERLAHGI
jgi:diadenosine tetraphosphatase ApaH/serine/threonine PP2A family protein phosphatase